MEEKKRTYDPQKVMEALLHTVTCAYGTSWPHPTLKELGQELGMHPQKVRKLLITAGVYESEAAEKILSLHRQGKTLEEIMDLTGLSRAAVHAYLPYGKIPYKTEEISQTAERLRIFRRRKAAVEALRGEMTMVKLWEALIQFQGYPFQTAKKLKFAYTIRGHELFVDRRGKSITYATVELAFQKALELGQEATGPKKLGCFGASYLYPVFARLGVIPGPERKG